MTAQNSDFSKGSVKRQIVAQAVPLTVAQIVQLLYNVVDRIYIGHLPEIGDLALTGLGITFPLIMLVNAFTNLFGTGGTTLFSLARGRRDEEAAEIYLGNVFALLVISSAALFGFCYALRKPILLLFGASPVSLEYADQYLQIYLFGTAFTMLATGLNGFINAQGFPRVGMLTTVLGAVLNIVLDPIFIFGLHMGVRGAALATIISQGVSALWVLRFLTGKKALLRIKLSRMRLSFARVKRIAALGFSGFVMMGTNSLVQIICNNQLQLFGGDLFVGIFTVIGSVREVLTMPVHGVTGGSQPVLGFNYGAKENGRVKEGIRFVSVVGIIYTMLSWLLVMLIPQQLMAVFSSEQETIVTGAGMLNIYFFGFVFMAFQFVGQTVFQALGKAKQAIFFSLFRKVIIVVPLTLLLPAIGFGVNGVFLAEPISNLIGGLACFITMWCTVYRKL